MRFMLKRSSIILMIILAFIIAIGTISAADANMENQTISADDNTDLETIQESSSDCSILNADDTKGTYKDLNDEIKKGNEIIPGMKIVRRVIFKPHRRCKDTVSELCFCQRHRSEKMFKLTHSCLLFEPNYLETAFCWWVQYDRSENEVPLTDSENYKKTLQIFKNVKTILLYWLEIDY